jgi:hypothetical protein
LSKSNTEEKLEDGTYKECGLLGAQLEGHVGNQKDKCGGKGGGTDLRLSKHKMRTL